MTSHPDQVIVTTESVPPLSAPALSVHHRDFPEVSAHGDSPADCAHQLVAQLSRTIDSAPSEFQRTRLEQAIEDLRGFIDNGAGGEAEERSCGTVYVDAGR
jgi:hypothetical protein